MNLSEISIKLEQHIPLTEQEKAAVLKSYTLDEIEAKYQPNKKPMADHVFKNKKTGDEHLLPQAFGKTPQAADWDDLGEGFIQKDATTGLNYVKLKKEPKVEAPALTEHPEEAAKKHKK